jgi:glycosyltransferase involved in cell wall biosynthesis
MKILIDVPKIPHTVVKELVDYPPANYVYESSFTNFLFPTSIPGFLKKRYELFRRKMNVDYKQENKSYDLIHANSKLLLNKKPWVVWTEHPISFFEWRNYSNLKSTIHKQIAKKYLASRFCKKVITHNTAAKNSLIKYLGDSDLIKKTEVVYPAYHLVNECTKKDTEKVTLLFIGRHFYGKGGREMLLAMEVLNRKYDVELTMVSPLSDSLSQKYCSIKNLTLHSNGLPYGSLMSLYSQADIYVDPLFTDGCATYLEAMSHGLPIVTTDEFANSEYVIDNKNGLLVKPPISLYGEGFLTKWNNWNEFVSVLRSTDTGKMVSELVDKLSYLIENRSVRAKLGQEGRREIRDGKFSIQKRNFAFRRIYEESLDR